MDSKDTKVSEQLLGKVAPRNVTGDHAVDVTALTKPLEKGDVIRVFCTGCGTCVPLGAEGAQALANVADVTMPEVAPRSFFKASRCIFCSDSDQFEEVSLEIL